MDRNSRDTTGRRNTERGSPARDMLRLGAWVGGGGLLLLQGLRRGGLAGAALGAAGAALLARGLRSGAALGSLRVPTRALPSAPVSAMHTVTIERPRAELFRFWRDVSNLSRILPDLDRVEVRDSRRSHWVARGPMGQTVEWDAEITDERPDEMIAWRSADGADVANSGRVEFRDAAGGRGTEVRLELEYEAPAGRLGQAVAKLFGEEPDTQARRALRSLKQMIESGEVSTTAGQPSARRPATTP